MRTEEMHHRLTSFEFYERYGESPEDFEEQYEKSLEQLECEAAGITF